MNSHGWSLRLAPFVVLLGGGALAANDGKSAAEMTLSKSANLTPQEMVAQSKELMSQMRDVQRRVEGLQEVAKKQKDIIKLNCVNDKLLQVRGHVAVGDNAIKGLDEAVAKGDDGQRQHEFSRLSILHQKVGVLGTEAENCIGEDLSYVGSTKVDVDVTGVDPNKDETAPTLPAFDIARPPVSTTVI